MPRDYPSRLREQHCTNPRGRVSPYDYLHPPLCDRNAFITLYIIMHTEDSSRETVANVCTRQTIKSQESRLSSRHTPFGPTRRGWCRGGFRTPLLFFKEGPIVCVAHQRYVLHGFLQGPSWSSSRQLFDYYHVHKHCRVHKHCSVHRYGNGWKQPRNN